MPEEAKGPKYITFFYNREYPLNRTKLVSPLVLTLLSGALVKISQNPYVDILGYVGLGMGLGYLFLRGFDLNAVGAKANQVRQSSDQAIIDTTRKEE